VLPPEAPRAGRPAEHSDGPLRRLAAIGVALAGIAVPAGCGDDDEAANEPPASASTELRIELDADGREGEPPEAVRVSCGGETEDPACPLVAELPANPAAQVPPDTACTEIFGGPDTATISGTLGGEPVEATLTRADGCQIERFDRFVPLLRELFPGYEPGASLAPP
jgi:hypothetical protein